MASSLIGRMLVGLGLDSSGLDKGTKQANKQLSFLQRQTKAVSAGIVRSMGAMGAAFAIGSVVSNAAKTVSDFDQKVANLAATAGKSRAQMGALVDNAKDVGAVSAFSSSQVLDLQTELAKLGNTESEIIAMTKSVGDFSIAVGSSAADAAILAGGVLKSFGKTANETESVVSSLAVATTKSALDFNKLNVALPLVGTAADQSGVSLERTVSLLGVLADRNIDASTSGTALRNIFLDLKDQGLTYEQAMAQINGSTDKLNEANKLFGKRGAVVATVLAESATQADTLEKNITGVDGALKKMTDERLNTVQGQTILLSSAWEGLVLSFDSGSGVLSNAYKNVVKGATTFISKLTEINQIDPAKEYKRETEELRNLLSALTKSNTGLETRKRIVDRLNKDYPEYIKNIDLENTSLLDVNKALTEYKKLNEDRVKNLVIDKKKNELLEKQRGLENKIVDITLQQEKNIQARDRGDLFHGSITAGEAALKQYKKQLSEVESELDKLFKTQQKGVKGGLGGGRDPSRLRGSSASVLPIIDDDGGKGKEEIKTLSETIGGLETKILELSEAYVIGGSKNDNFITSIQTLQTKLLELNAQLNESVAIRNSLLRGDQTISAPAAIGSTGIAGSIQSQTGGEKVKLSEGFLQKAINDTEALTTANDGLAASFIALADSMGNSLSAGANSFSEFASSALKSIQAVIGGLIKEAVATAVTSALRSAPFPFNLGLGTIAGGLASGMFNTALNSVTVPKLADGGVINKPTFAMLGEYSGAATNPEIAAPESKLRDIFGSELRKGGSNRMYSVVKGSDIYQSQDKYNYRLSRTG